MWTYWVKWYDYTNWVRIRGRGSNWSLTGPHTPVLFQVIKSEMLTASVNSMNTRRRINQDQNITIIKSHAQIMLVCFGL